jgi:hypothetical protein
MISYARRQIDEIAADPALRLYGIALLAAHALTGFWLLHGRIASTVAAGQPAICWPLVPECESLHQLSEGQLEIAFAVYLGAAFLFALGFARKGSTAFGYAGLLLLTVFKVAVIALDFRLRRNQHYMQFAATAAFLLVPNKRETLQLLLVLFYFWAGTLKLNWEWLSGAALYRPLWLFTGRGIIVACAYVIVMELVVVWGLLARDRRIFWLCFAQVLVFHVFSWAVVGFFYPLLMFGLLAIFPLCRLIPAPRPGASLGEAILRGRLSRSAALVALVFSAMQLSTHLYPGDTAITGEGRLFALHMFDARVVCDARIVLKLKDGRRVDHELADQGIRTRCDPILIHGRARNLCRQLATDMPMVADLDVHLLARRATDSELRRVIDISDFCATQPRYAPFLHNDWIIAEP